MTNKFNNTLNKLMTSTHYQNQEEVLRDLEVLREEYLKLKECIEDIYEEIKPEEGEKVEFLYSNIINYCEEVLERESNQ